MADAGVGDQPLDVALGQGDQRPVDDAATDSHSSHGSRTAVASGSIGRLNRTKAVGADLQQDAGQDHAAGRRGLHVGQRQPGVQRKQRHLDRESGKQCQEDQPPASDNG